jgi:hypothetical protein
MKALDKEKKTIAAMIRIFCDAHHGAARKPLCPECSDLLEYARERLDKCPFGQNKGACSKCDIHCYKPVMREQVTQVMRYSGPRMLKKHPLLAIDHLLKTRGIGRGKGNGER